METPIDFSQYTLEDLYSSASSINRELYPERAKLIDDLIHEKEQSLRSEIADEDSLDLVDDNRASRGHRFAAALIDGLIAIIVTVPVIIYIGVDKIQEASFTTLALLFLYGSISTLTLHGYLLYKHGQTIGKNYMHIRIEKPDGNKASLTTIYFKRMLPMQIVGLIPGFGNVIAAIVNTCFIFGKDRRCLHDYIANTKVCYITIDESNK